MNQNERFRITWHDRQREATVPADRTFPNGRDIDYAGPGARACLVELAHPASRVGFWTLFCLKCRSHAGVGTAGRADDPRSVRVPCADAGPGR
jgi:hypothetical protein